MDPVEVYCRVKPLTDNSSDICVKVLDEQTLQITEPTNPNRPMTSSQYEENIKMTQAKFTHLFDMESTQEEVFNRVAYELCEDLVKGSNGLLFTYGITGSGKTYTMSGIKAEPGILPRCLDLIFNSISPYLIEPMVFIPDKMNKFDVRLKCIASLERAKQNLLPIGCLRNRRFNKKNLANDDWDLNSRNNNNNVIKIPISKFDEDCAFAVFVSYVEIYNDYIYDLLDQTDQKNGSKKLREDINRFTYVSGVTEREVRNTQEALDVLEEGRKNRRQASTALNAESSRSHSVFNIRLVKAALDEGGSEVLQDKSRIWVSQLSLVDLAGSERSSRTGNINSSLMFLRECLKALREKQKNGSKKTVVSYRSCTLTNLFKNYFDGEGKVRMIVCINPSSIDYDENMDVLSFAEMTKDVRILPSAANPSSQTDWLTPGRKRAAQIITEVKAEMEREISRQVQESQVLNTIFPDRPAFYTSVKSLGDMTNPPQLSNLKEEQALARFKQYYDAKLKLRQELLSKQQSSVVAFEEALRKYVFDSECLRKKHEDCERYMRETDLENQQLKSENIKLKQQISSLDHRLKKSERDTRFYQNQEEAIRKGENKLRAVKEIVSRMPGQVSVAKKRGPSPPPKPFRQKDMNHNLRKHRRSQSIGDLLNENQPPINRQVPSSATHYDANSRESKKVYCIA
uniref:Kinesin-like protein n=1 Tax=Romanomermis culicivorax TaxID=13658 RepID=A0A915JUV4_ROMCU